MNAAITILLGLAIAITWLSALGLLLARDIYQRFHFMGPAATVGVAILTVAILFSEGMDPSAVKAIVVTVISCLASGLLSHALGRAARLRQFAIWEPDAAQVRPPNADDSAGLETEASPTSL